MHANRSWLNPTTAMIALAAIGLSLFSAYMTVAGQIGILLSLIIFGVLFILAIYAPLILLMIMPLMSVFLVPSPIEGVSIERMMAPLLLVSWVNRRYVKDNLTIDTPRSILISLMVFMVATLVTYNPSVAVGDWLSAGLIYWFNRLFYMIAIYELIQNRTQVRAILRVIVIGGVVLALWVMPTVIFICGDLGSLRTEVLACRDLLVTGNYFTQTAAFLNTHAFTFAVSLLFLWLYKFTESEENEQKQSRRSRYPLWFWLINVLFIVGIVGYANSRRGILFLIAVSVFVIWGFRKKPRLWQVAIVLSLLLGSMILSQGESDPFRAEATIIELQTGSGDRLPLWQVTWEAIQLKPWFGWGAGAPNQALIEYYGREWTLSSTLMDLAYQMGIVGVAAMVLIFLVVGRYILISIISGYHSQQLSDEYVNFGAAAVAMFAIAVIALVVTNNMGNIFTWFCWGLMIAGLKNRNHHGVDQDT